MYLALLTTGSYKYPYTFLQLSEVQAKEILRLSDELKDLPDDLALTRNIRTNYRPMLLNTKTALQDINNLHGFPLSQSDFGVAYLNSPACVRGEDSTSINYWTLVIGKHGFHWHLFMDDTEQTMIRTMYVPIFHVRDFVEAVEKPMSNDKSVNKVWVLKIFYSSGTEEFICAAEELAKEQLYMYVKDCWNDSYPHTDMPADHIDAISDYFSYNDEESYVLYEEEVLTKVVK